MSSMGELMGEFMAELLFRKFDTLHGGLDFLPFLEPNI